MSINFAIHNFYITRVIPTVDDNLVDAGTDHFGCRFRNYITRWTSGTKCGNSSWNYCWKENFLMEERDESIDSPNCNLIFKRYNRAGRMGEEIMCSPIQRNG